MTEARYKIETDIGRRFVRLTLYGFWDETTLERYKVDVRAMMAAAAKRPKQEQGFRVLLDMREHTLLAKNLADSLQGTMGRPPAGQRTAILLADAQLLKRQAGRVASALEPKFFDNEDDAMKWLFEEPVAG